MKLEPLCECIEYVPSWDQASVRPGDPEIHPGRIASQGRSGDPPWKDCFPREIRRSTLEGLLLKGDLEIHPGRIASQGRSTLEGLLLKGVLEIWRSTLEGLLLKGDPPWKDCYSRESWKSGDPPWKDCYSRESWKSGDPPWKDCYSREIWRSTLEGLLLKGDPPWKDCFSREIWRSTLEGLLLKGDPPWKDCYSRESWRSTLEGLLPARLCSRGPNPEAGPADAFMLLVQKRPHPPGGVRTRITCHQPIMAGA
ncbi:hypothetical protein NDU88_007565 [Pleurodeles waltl]|uniref:Uncharacterized protein n=1 Tax=Pleurodeles waltl TaxID=8319 RepID=A0AAV7MHF8_PLEWA|nr:hypothetical protein NDU88_007565 [Pleurodeles waltl]